MIIRVKQEEKPKNSNEEKTTYLIALHGFLGCPSDWEPLIKRITKNKEASSEKWLCRAPDYLNSFDLNPQQCPLNEWGQRFNQRVKQELAQTPGEVILVAYSMGGRLALHALHAEPSLYKQAFIISAHPGLNEEVDKKERLEKDFEWAERFLKEPLSEVLAQWNAQDVFKHSLSIPDREKYLYVKERLSYPKETLAACLKEWSLGLQDNLLQKLPQKQNWIYWFVGERDQKYSDLLEESISKYKFIHCEKIQKAGHRVPWDQEELFSMKLMKLIDDFSILS